MSKSNRTFIDAHPLIMTIVRLISVLTVVGVVVYALIGPWFRLQFIVCYHETEPIICPPALTDSLAVYHRGSVFTLPLVALRSRLVSALTQYELTGLSVQLPQTLMVTLTPKTPVADVLTVSGDFNALVTIDGVIISTPQTPTNLPQIILPFPPQVTDQQVTTETALAAIRLAHDLDQKGIIDKPLVVKDNTLITLELVGGQTVLFSPLVSATRQVTTLQRILGAVTMKSDNPLIDVRFDQPVLKPLPSSTPVASQSGLVINEGE